MKSIVSTNPKVSISPFYDDILGIKPKADTEIRIKNLAFRHALESSTGNSFLKTAENLFISRGIENFDEEYFEKVLNDQIAIQRGWEWALGWSVSELPEVEKHKIFKKIFDKACTDTYLNQYRKELSSWINKVEKGKALFVDCLMGLGKTYSIVKALGQNPNLSAVIFMPTNKLCERMVQDLKSEILNHDPNIKNKYPGVVEKEETPDENDGSLDDILGLPRERWTRKFLGLEVYHADGINEKECPNFHKIIARYRENWLSKKNICQSCENRVNCRFLLHDEKAPLSQIIITTHHQYDRFYNNREIRKWYKNGYENKNDAVERDLIIVDEDMVVSQCYQPFYVEYRELQTFLTTVREFIDQYSGSEEINEKLSSLFGKVGLCNKTSFIRPIDPKFRFPRIIREEWNESTKNLLRVLPNLAEQAGLIGNHLEMIEDAIRFGMMVQIFGNRYRIYFSNRKSYDLSNLPPHVFFDGTMIDKTFLKKKLQNVKLERMKIPVKPLWDLKIWQNRNTDLSNRGISAERERVEGYLRFMLNFFGPAHKYFILSSKSTWTGYLKDLIHSNFPHIDYVHGYFGNLRGINDAKDCEIGFMLGSYIPSDAVEIAMSLEFIQNALPKKAISPTYVNFWSWKGSKGRRIYKRKYDVINKMAKVLRYSEHRQAMARTRYLFHDVDFHVFSKDPVSEYEPYAQIMDKKFREDIFPPRAERSDSKYEEVKEKIIRLIIQEGQKLGEMDLHRITGYSRTTIRKHLKRIMQEEVLIVRDGKKYTYLKGV